ncbi:dTDP-4-dehydrorhamnose reductase [Aestuariicella hydrocarbonica]|uniref:dTDP-4-dehydrorhamnose reductase n=1 Tax=Pseudomaricurvus hydrocarbonicus TaxID=1470433 RepID=A0A9E5JSA0_9GAMM|nr:dTDP-4-dehydrorhamnose reductase [Aestuariicella hydrocarbonica]NHO64471.1 dTDP-4-dehydrorhamnose reductase [Aestuariicella hydrocarbonica]
MAEMILITGSGGQVGYELLKTLAPLGQVKGLCRKDGDLSDPDVVNQLLSTYKPTCIVNAAAYTAVDQAESDFPKAKALNAELPALLAQWASANNAIMVHYSTDYVYDGSGEEPWTEEAKPNPLSVYGRTKLDGDVAVLEFCNNAVVLRTSWVYGARGSNFMLTMLKLAAERNELRVVDDQWGAPTPAWLIAQVTAAVVLSKQKALDCHSGIYHLACRGETSWCGFAKSIINGALDLGSKAAMSGEAVFPITTEDYPVPAPRPANSRLDVSKLEESFRLTIPDWESALRVTLQDWQERQLTK